MNANDLSMSQFVSKDVFLVTRNAVQALKAYRECPKTMNTSGLCIVSEGYRYDEGSISIYLDYDGRVKATANG